MRLRGCLGLRTIDVKNRQRRKSAGDGVIDMKLAAMALGLALVAFGTAALAQVGGPNHGPKPAVGGPSTGTAAGASVGGPTNKGTQTTGKSSTVTPKKGH
jgi:hypothetical protein